LETAFRAV